jgi:hypothetical protein
MAAKTLTLNMEQSLRLGCTSGAAMQNRDESAQDAKLVRGALILINCVHDSIVA